MRLNSIVFTLLIAIYSSTLNIDLLYKLYLTIHTQSNLELGLTFSIPILFVALFNIIFSIFTLKYLIKPIVIIWILISSLVLYYQFQYGVVFDLSMITNIFETTRQEATSLLNYNVVVWFLASGVLPSILIFKTTIIYNILAKEILYKILSIFISMIVIIIIFMSYGKQISYIARNNIVTIKTSLVPTYFSYNLGQYINNYYFKKKLPYKEIGTDAHAKTHARKKKNLVIIVVGESARSMNFELNGYYKNTNQYTKKHGIISFKNVTSCGTSTAVSVPCMFCIFEQKIYSPNQATSQDNLADIIKRAGINIV